MWVVSVILAILALVLGDFLVKLGDSLVKLEDLPEDTVVLDMAPDLR
jgi:hypothetical protein